ncbi:MAG: dihydrodipicolinate synthase family protein [Clostridia bacterium]|nr:dihydrodipicolinate synthase family protein [Clostridia bacterium]
MNKLFQGIMPALITPFDAQGRFKAASAEAIMKRELDQGVQGFYVNGATGEGLFLSEQTRRESAECAVETCKGRGKVIVHVGAVDAQQALRLARHAGETGCDAVSSLVPNYINQYTVDQILDYYRRLHEESGLPVLVYCTGLVGSAPYEFMKKAIQVPGLIGCKYTMFDYYSMHRITELNGGDINVINGPDEMLICGLTMGADGGIGSTYNLMPERFLALFKAFREGRFDDARLIQFGINKVIAVLLARGCIAAIKEVFNVMGYDAGCVAYPGKVFDAEESKALIAELREAGLEI